RSASACSATASEAAKTPSAQRSTRPASTCASHPATASARAASLFRRVVQELTEPRPLYRHGILAGEPAGARLGAAPVTGAQERLDGQALALLGQGAGAVAPGV